MALALLNPHLPSEALEDAFRKLIRPEGATLEARNRAFHRMLVDGVTVEYRAGDGAIRGAQAQIIDFDEPANNDWLAVNQFTVTENRHTRRRRPRAGPTCAAGCRWLRMVWCSPPSHIRNKPRREGLAKRFRNATDPLRIVLVRDMWLTGFDAPSLHTMYVDKPMRGHGLMQAIARVNRVFKDKPGGLVVDYLGLAHELKRALATYTESGGTGKTALNQSEAVAVMLEKYEVCLGLFHGFDWSGWTTGTPAERLGLLPPAQEHILAQDNGKERCLRAGRPRSRGCRLDDAVEDIRRATSLKADGRPLENCRFPLSGDLTHPGRIIRG